MHAWLEWLVSWVGAHPGLSGGVVFLIALGESLAVIGLLIPGSAVMFAIGALVAAGALNVWVTLGAAAAGAVIGDSLSYLLGFHYRDRMHMLWPFRTHPQWLATGEGFIARHGGKSVLFGRFVGPVRPIVPVVAGMMRMEPRRFLLANVVSGLLWSPAYIGPGIGFGVAFDLVSRIALRLALLLGLLVAILWFSGWGIHRLHSWLVPRAVSALASIAEKRTTHPKLGRLAGVLVDPRSPDLGALAAASLVLILAIWGLHFLAEGGAWHQADAAISQYFAEMRSPLGDEAMSWLSGLGSIASLAALAAWGCLWLVIRREWRLLLYWMGASLLGLSLLALNTSGLVEPSARMSSGSAWQVSLYGLLAMLMAQRLRGDLRWLPYSLAGLLLAGDGLARVYLGLNGVSEWLGGLLLGVIWITLVGVACLTHVGSSRSVGGLVIGGLVAGIFGLAVTQHTSPSLPSVVPTFTSSVALPEAQWWGGKWRQLPAYRVRLDGERAEPLNVQWAGKLTLMESFLKAQGWHPPPRPRLSAAVDWLLPGPERRHLPLFLRLNEGRAPVLVQLHPLAGAGSKELVLRLWPSAFHLDDGQPIWVGSLRQRSLIEPLGLLLLPRYREVVANNLVWLKGEGVKMHVVQRPGPGKGSNVILLHTNTVK